MQATISVSGRGLIALPAELRKAAGIRPQDSIIAETTPDCTPLRGAAALGHARPRPGHGEIAMCRQRSAPLPHRTP
jgi:bifunctional DNA-binding transcriptional regulator/antitoxin component of YhaV-PrlF toxin-antitoxin module